MARSVGRAERFPLVLDRNHLADRLGIKTFPMTLSYLNILLINHHNHAFKTCTYCWQNFFILRRITTFTFGCNIILHSNTFFSIFCFDLRLGIKTFPMTLSYLNILIINHHNHAFKTCTYCWQNFFILRRITTFTFGCNIILHSNTFFSIFCFDTVGLLHRFIVRN